MRNSPSSACPRPLDGLLASGLKPGQHRTTRGTGVWPSVLPRPWNMTSIPGEAMLIDPVAVASEAAQELENIGWPGISLMDTDFQMGLLDINADKAGPFVEQWFSTHCEEVCSALSARLQGYDVAGLSKTAKTAMAEALINYRSGLYLSAVRVLLPEFECFARAIVLDKTQKFTQKRVIDDLRALLAKTPVVKDDPLETFSLFHFIEDRLFAQCYTEVDAHSFGSIPNRHAEIHGFASYGNLQGATTLVCVMDLLLRMMDRLKRLGAFNAAAAP